MAKKEEWRQFALVLGIISILLIILAAFFLLKPYRFESSEKSVSFFSNDFPVEHGLQQFSQEGSVLVVAQLESEGAMNGFMSNASNLFSVVLIGNQKKTTNVFMVVDSSDRLLECQTNYGDPSKNETLTTEQCHSFLDSFDGGKLFLFLPDSKQSKALVLLKPRVIEVRPSNPDTLSAASYSALKKMFSNADEIIRAVNDLAGRLG